MNFKCKDPKNIYKSSCCIWPGWSKAAAAIKAFLHGFVSRVDSMDSAFGSGSPGISGQKASAAPGMIANSPARPNALGNSKDAERRKQAMMQGVVKWFNEKKGFGFIQGDDGSDIFVHYSEVQSEGFKTLYEGQRVQFERKDGPKGPAAAKVRIL